LAFSFNEKANKYYGPLIRYLPHIFQVFAAFEVYRSKRLWENGIKYNLLVFRFMFSLYVNRGK